MHYAKRLAIARPSFSISFLTLLGVLIALCCSSTVFAEDYLVSATVEPARTILIDRLSTIVEITSNTPLGITPLVYEVGMQNAPIPMSPAVETQYLILTRGSDFAKPRIIYGHKTLNSIPSNTNKTIGRHSNILDILKILSGLVRYVPMDQE